MHTEEEKNRTITLNGTSVAPGENSLVHIKIARLPTGTLIEIPIHIFNAKNPGPVVLIQAGLHGDEINGVETLRRMLHEQKFQIKNGTAIVVPILNVFGFIHFSRDVPDGKDVNRSFPGSKKGSLASRMAYHYTSELLPQIEYCIDLHTGGGQRKNYPQIRYSEGDLKSKELAQAFGAPFNFPSRLIQGSFRKAAFKMGIPTVVYEAGESMRFDELSIEHGISGVERVLMHLKMLPKPKGLKNVDSIYFESTRWVRASKAGMFIPKIANGAAVSKGQVLGWVTDTYAKRNREIKSPFDGYVFCINHQAVVNQGDALFHIGRVQ